MDSMTDYSITQCASASVARLLSVPNRFSIQVFLLIDSSATAAGALQMTLYEFMKLSTHPGAFRKVNLEQLVPATETEL